MATMTTTDPTIVDRFRQYRAALDQAYDRAEEHMEAGRWQAAHTTLCHITELHAKNAVGLRNALVRKGLMRGDDA
jgi:hypothetical protein